MTLGIGDNAFTRFELGLEPSCALSERVQARQHLFQVVQNKGCRISLQDIVADTSLNPEFKSAIIAKLAGHLFSFKDSFPSGLCATNSFNGFSEHITLPFFVDQLEKLRNSSLPLKDSEIRFVVDVLKESLSPDPVEEDYFEKLASAISTDLNRLFLLPSGNQGHLSYYLIWNRFLIYMDKGAGCGASPGVQVYALPDRSCLTAETLKFIVNRIPRLRGEKWPSSNWISTTLGLVKSFDFISKKQKIGNCTWAVMTLISKTLLAVQRLNCEGGLFMSFLENKPYHIMVIRKIKRNFVKELRDLAKKAEHPLLQTTCIQLLALVPAKYNLVVRIPRPCPSQISAEKHADKRQAVEKNMG